MATAVVHTALKPLHDVTLTDGSTTVGFVLTDASGRKNERAINETPQARTAIKMTSGDSKYSDLIPPWSDIVQDDWSGGRGAIWFEDDKSKHYDSSRVDTSSSRGLILGACETYAFGNHNNTLQQRWISNDTYTTWAETGYIAQKVTLSATASAVRGVQFLVKWQGATTDIVVSVRADSAGAPAAAKLQYASLTIPNTDDPIYSVFIGESSWNTIATLTGGASYWFVIENPSGQNLEVYGYSGASANCLDSAAGSVWAQSGLQLYIRVVELAPYSGGIFFEYKSAMYFISQPSTGNSYLYRNGTRGVADSNVADLSYLYDSSQTWSTDYFAGNIVMITRGTGIEEEKPWRTITSNEASRILCSEDWKIQHDTTTEYVVIASNVWYEVMDLGAPVTDVAVADEIVYFARGQATQILRYQEYVSTTGWTVRTSAESEVSAYARKILALQRGGDTYIYRAREGQDLNHWSLVENISPRAWGGLIPTNRALLATTDSAWDSWVITNVTQSVEVGGYTKVTIATAFTTGYAAVKNLDTPIDITSATRIGFYIKSSIAAAAAQLKLTISDGLNLNPELVAASIMQYDNSGAAWIDHANAYDGATDTSATIAIDTSDWVYFISEDRFNELYFTIGTPNAQAATATYQYFDGEIWKDLTVTDGTIATGVPFATSAAVTWTIPHDWQPKTVNLKNGYGIRVKVNVLCSFGTSEVSVQRDTRVALDLPALTADEWAWVTLTITPTTNPATDYSRIQSLAISLTADAAAQVISLQGGIWAMTSGVVLDFPEQTITGLVAYAGSASATDNPWVFTDRGVYEIQTENGGQIVKLPIGEISSIRSPLNGRAHCVNDVYLYFNLGQKLQRYYSRNLDDVGPDKGADWGDTGRDGQAISAVSYPGRVYAAFRKLDGDFSSIYAYDGGGWHDVYRSPTGVQIHDIYHQSFPDRMTTRLWFAEGRDIGWMPVSLDPHNDPDYDFSPEGFMTSAWISGGLLDVVKVFKSATVFMEKETGTSVEMDYMLDAETTWTTLSGAFDTEPSEEINFPTSSNGVRGKRFRYRLRLKTTNQNYSPRVQAVLLANFAVVPTKYSYNFTSVMREDHMSINLQGEQEQVLDYTSRAETAYAQLKTWANGGYPLTMNSRFSVYDNKTVILNPPASSPVRIDSDAQQEEILLAISVFDL